ncbi:hypothetical protein [Rhodococcus sp. NPDC058514]|uniref:hypothetical protein n=1 Tax=unclassified Rhodococcus (in: high G+C Gram-positive bacteria) TaxID=192944 RepID=UPI0036645388
MSTHTKFTRTAAVLAIGGAAMLGVPALASAAPFTWNSGDDGGSAADVTSDGTTFTYTLDNTSGAAVAVGVNVSTFQFLGSSGIFDAAGPAALAPGTTAGGADDGITVHLIQGGTYDSGDGNPEPVGTGYAVTW